jgi:hypothetical protein
VTMRLTSRHAEIVGGVMVEPGSEFDESKVDSSELDRLTKEGKAREVSAPTKKSSGKGS